MYVLPEAQLGVVEELAPLTLLDPLVLVEGEVVVPDVSVVSVASSPLELTGAAPPVNNSSK